MKRHSPVFIIGNPRSGTTLIRLMLTCHPRICIPPESGFLLWWKSKYENMSATQLQASLPEIMKDIFSSRKFDKWDLDYHTVLEYVRTHSPSTYAEIGALVYAAYEKKQKRAGCQWGDKNNYYLDHIPEILELYPDAYLIHLIRDGRDVACSYMELSNHYDCSEFAPKLPRKIHEIAKQWNSNIKTIGNSFQKISKNQRLTVKYESLVLEPEPELSRICSFLGERYSANMMNYPKINLARALEPVSFLQWKERTVLPPQRDRVKRFEKILTINQIHEFEYIAYDMLSKYGYIN